MNLEQLLDKLQLKFRVENDGHGMETYIYQTDWGFQLKRLIPGDLWMYQYQTDLDGLPENVSEHRCIGCLQKKDVLKILQQLIQDPTLLQKPDGIIKLQEMTKVTAYRKVNEFGKWHLKTSSFSLFNNPFSLPYGATNSAQEYEVWFFDEAEPRGHQTYAEIIDALNQRGLLKK